MDQRRTQPRQSPKEQRRLDLDDAPELDSSEEAALEAIRRQLDAEFDAVEAVRDAPDAVADQPATRTEPEPRYRPALVRFAPVDTPPAAGKALESAPEPHVRFVPPETSAAPARRTGLEPGPETHVRFLPTDVSAAPPRTAVEPVPPVPPRAAPDTVERARPAGPRQP
ncbi:MAG TPA: hypothetical protein VLA62_03995, partial [Solirubrobacterales bacterium]|nr:hypothetical protein [Solirubrobacterales bacterium]